MFSLDRRMCVSPRGRFIISIAKIGHFTSVWQQVGLSTQHFDTDSFIGEVAERQPAASHSAASSAPARARLHNANKSEWKSKRFHLLADDTLLLQARRTTNCCCRVVDANQKRSNFMTRLEQVRRRLLLLHEKSALSPTEFFVHEVVDEGLFLPLGPGLCFPLRERRRLRCRFLLLGRSNTAHFSLQR